MKKPLLLALASACLMGCPLGRAHHDGPIADLDLPPRRAALGCAEAKADTPEALSCRILSEFEGAGPVRSLPSSGTPDQLWAGREACVNHGTAFFKYTKLILSARPAEGGSAWKPPAEAFVGAAVLWEELRPSDEKECPSSKRCARFETVFDALARGERPAPEPGLRPADLAPTAPRFGALARTTGPSLATSDGYWPFQYLRQAGDKLLGIEARSNLEGRKDPGYGCYVELFKIN